MITREFPPRRGTVLAIELDNVARSYSLAELALGGYTPDAANSRQQWVDIVLEAESTDCWFSFSRTAQAIDETSRVAAGGTLAFADNMAGLVEGGTGLKVSINRAEDIFLNVKGAGAGTLRLWTTTVSV